ncbi:lactonase family protein [Edaphobacter bradus]|uniref:lactonase family protein n=1 Tax=Edaphobacter bradus TaxID=2259016 RepID=UPI0021DF8DDB|nr:lactonase family protein [Edaphobacter bradus]
MSWRTTIRRAVSQTSTPRRSAARRAVASAILLPLAFSLTSCTRDYTVAYLYATATSASGAGVVNEYLVDYQSGALVAASGSPVKAGNNPVKLVTSPNGLFVYVVNQGDSTVQEFAVNAANGTLSSKNTYKTGSAPTSAAIDVAGKFLYVTYTYQSGYSATNPGPGGINIFPINSDNSLGTATSVNIGNNPVGIVTSNFSNYVYVVDQEPASGTSAQHGVILGFSQNTSTGALTPATGTTITTDSTGKTVATGYGAGTVPSAIAIDPTARFVYVTDRSTNQLYGSGVQAGGRLTPMTNSPFATGLLPVSITIDPRGLYLYVANFNSNTVGAYVIDQATGAAVGSVGSGSTQVGTGPSCVAIDPALGVYLYTANNLDNTITGQKLDSHNGGLKAIENTPFPASGLPTCVASVANGSHATQIVVP